MKLYTEEQVKDMLNGVMQEHHIDEFLKQYYTPIELPSDEEIGKGCDDNIPLDEQDMWSERFYFRVGVKWVIEQIKNKYL